MKCFYLPLLLLWLIPVVITQMALGFVSASPARTFSEQPRLRLLLQTSDTSFTVEVAANGTLSGILAFEEER